MVIDGACGTFAHASRASRGPRSRTCRRCSQGRAAHGATLGPGGTVGHRGSAGNAAIMTADVRVTSLGLACAMLLLSCERSPGPSEECSDDADCPAETPACLDGLCAECVESKDCPAGRPEWIGLECQACGPAFCPANTPYCGPMGGCAECERVELALRTCRFASSAHARIHATETRDARPAIAAASTTAFGRSSVDRPCQDDGQMRDLGIDAAWHVGHSVAERNP